MSTWRRKIIESFPQLKGELESPDCSIYTAFSELLGLTSQAHRNNDEITLHKVYQFAEWCFNQKSKDLWNAAGVSFYEHLGDDEHTRRSLAKWVKPEIYKQIRGLLEDRISEEKLKEIDSAYNK